MKTVLNKILLLFIFLCPALSGQNNTDSYLNIESLLITLKARQADILFPTEFQEFQLEFERIQKDSDDSDWELYENQLKNLEQDLESWILKSINAQNFFEEVLSAREKAVQAGAVDFATDSFTRAETQLTTAAKAYQKGNNKQALKFSKESETLFQKAEFETIRNHLLGEIRILIQECSDFHAEKFAPNAYQATLQMLSEVEVLIENNRYNDSILSQKSRKLYSSAKHLLYISKTIYFIHQAPENAELFISGIEEELTALMAQLGHSYLSNTETNELLTNILTVVQHLIKEKEVLAQKNQQLEKDKRELEEYLLKYKSLSDQKLYFEKKIERVKANLEGNVERQGRFLTLTIEPFLYKEQEFSINAIDPDKLASVLNALHEFFGYSLLIRFFQPASVDINFNQYLADRRAAAIKEHLKSQLIFQNTEIQAAGVVYDPGKSIDKANTYLEIRIDLGDYPFWNKHSVESVLITPDRSSSD
jgi:hypothetical protein